MKSILLTTIAAVLVVGCGESQPPEPPTAKAPDISIHEAAKAGNIETVKQHLAAGTDVNAESRDKYRGTPLHFAALGGHKELIELLIVIGADVNANSNGGTPLHIAAGSGHKEAVELLIAKGAGVNAKEGFTGSTPLNEATGQGHNQVIELLIAKGADVNAKNGLGFTPLDMATIPDTRFDTTETADLLRKHGGKHSSIHEAAAGGDAEGVKEFLAAATDVNTKDDLSRTPLDYAEGETADLLRKHGGKTGEELKAEAK